MGAETRVYVKVLTMKHPELVTEWIEVQAITLDDAVEKVERLKDVYRVIDAQYDKQWRGGQYGEPYGPENHHR